MTLTPVVVGAQAKGETMSSVQVGGPVDFGLVLPLFALFLLLSALLACAWAVGLREERALRSPGRRLP